MSVLYAVFPNEIQDDDTRRRRVVPQWRWEVKRAKDLHRSRELPPIDRRGLECAEYESIKELSGEVV